MSYLIVACLLNILANKNMEYVTTKRCSSCGEPRGLDGYTYR